MGDGGLTGIGVIARQARNATADLLQCADTRNHAAEQHIIGAINRQYAVVEDV
ncbi:hypothetical protein D3C73_1617920 [compost metagenome]